MSPALPEMTLSRDLAQEDPAPMQHHLVVVDDDPAIVELLEVILEAEGYSVNAFESPEAALEAILKSPPDALVADLMMPGMTGLELVEAIRGTPQGEHLPILICSAYYESLGRAADKLDEWKVRMLRKPFHIGELLENVAQLVSGKITPMKNKRRGRRSQGGNMVALMAGGLRAAG